MLIISDYSRKSENYRCSYFHKEPFQISQIWSECLSLGNPNIFYQLKIWLLSGHKRKVCPAWFFLLHSYSWMKFNEVKKKKIWFCRRTVLAAVITAHTAAAHPLEQLHSQQNGPKEQHFQDFSSKDSTTVPFASYVVYRKHSIQI